ncbi:ATP-binding protein [Streptomyces seoulensis]|nr:ATP-binding protein [Streptomyces seoulensis]
MFAAGAIVASVIPSPPLGTAATAGLAVPGARTAPGPDGTVAERRFRFELAAHPGSPAQARRLTRARLTGWSVCEDTCDTATLVVSELVTNAIVHTASSRVVCELSDGPDLVRIAVRDEGCAPGEPHPSPQRPEEEHGRGLMLVEALSHAWGTREHGSGLVVWAELPRTAAATAPDDDTEPDGERRGAGLDAPPGSAPGRADEHPSERGESHGPGFGTDLATGPGTDLRTGFGTDLGTGSGEQRGAGRGAGSAPGVGRQAGPGEDRTGRSGREVRGDLGWGAPQPTPERPAHPHRETEDSARTGRTARHGASHATTHGTGAVWL